MSDLLSPTYGGSLVPKNSFFELLGDHVRRYLWVSDFVKERTVLDIGCGHGYGSYYLAANAKAKSVVGIDTDVKAIEFARSNYKLPNLEFHFVDVEKKEDHPLNGHIFQSIISFEVIEHLRNGENLLEFAKMLMTADGEFYISTPNKLYTEQTYRNGRPIPSFHIKEYYPHELEKLLSKHFNIGGIYVEYDVNGYDQDLAHTLSISSSVPIPNIIRKIAPEFLKITYYKTKGLTYRNNHGTYSKYVIEEVHSHNEVGKDKAVQIFKLVRKKRS
jgi:SAM-dependent methyltransferase